MPAVGFNRDATARRHAKEFLKVDPGLRSLRYLPTGAPEREIRLLAVNDQIAEINDRELVAVDLGVDRGGDGEHTLLILDVTPRQWQRIEKAKLALPDGWSLEREVVFEPKR